MSKLRHPAFMGVLVGVVMAVLSTLHALSNKTEAFVWTGILVVFAFWLSRWIRFQVFGPGVWLGLFLGLPSVLAHLIFWGTYRTHHPELAPDAARGSFFAIGLIDTLVFSVLLALLAAVLAIRPRKRLEREMHASASKPVP